MIPAAQFKTQMDGRRDIVIACNNSDNPALARDGLFGILEVIDDVLSSALRDKKSAPTSVTVAIDSKTWNTPDVATVAAHFIAMGYGFEWSNGVATISW